MSQRADPRPQQEVGEISGLAHWLTEETGYVQIMGTKPQTLSFGLTDSPAGLASWIVEKWRSWSDCGGDVNAHFGRDTLLTNVHGPAPAHPEVMK